MELLARPDGLGSFSSPSSRSCICAKHTCKAPGANFGLRGLCVMVGLGAQFWSDQEMISVVGLSVGYLLENSAR